METIPNTQLLAAKKFASSSAERQKAYRERKKNDLPVPVQSTSTEATSSSCVKRGKNHVESDRHTPGIRRCHRTASSSRGSFIDCNAKKRNLFHLVFIYLSTYLKAPLFKERPIAHRISYESPTPLTDPIRAESR